MEKRIIADLDKAFYPETFVVPFMETVHDRAVEEVLRGCIRGCRFCQAGFLYRPFREKSPETIVRQCRSLCDTTGYQELSLSSLSTSDHSRLEETLNELLPYLDENRINITLPSLRVDNFSRELMERIQGVRKSSLILCTRGRHTAAPGCHQQKCQRRGTDGAPQALPFLAVLRR